MLKIDEDSLSVKEELLTQASSNLSLSLLGLMANVFALCIAFWDTSNSMIISVWFIAILFIIILRYKKAKSFLTYKNTLAIQAKEKEFKTLALITAVILSTGIITLFPDNDPFYQAFLTMILAGLSAGAVMSLSVYGTLIRNYLIVLIAPYIYVIYDNTSEINILISAMILMFLILLVSFSKRYHKNILDLIVSKLMVKKTEIELQHSKNNFSTIFEEATVGVFTYNTELIIQDSNIAFSSILDAPHNKIINLNMKQLPDQNIRQCLDSVFKGKKGFFEGIYHTKLSDKDIWVSMETVPMYDTNKDINGGLAIVTDITDKIKSEEKIRHQASYDNLTGLANRLTLNKKLRSHISRLLIQNNFGSVLFIDLDHFKTINDSLGHHVGDAILKTFAKRALSILREQDTMSRLGGDEFVILLENLSTTQQEAINISKNVANKLHELMKQPIKIRENSLHMTLSIGINIIDSEQKNIHDILKHADTAMYQAKELGRNTTCFYEEEMSQQIEEKLTLNNELHQALKLNQFELYYQPIVELKSSNITSCEALIRWNHPQRGLVYPDSFIPHAQESDLIISIGDWVIDTACKHYKECNDKIEDIAINISSKQFIKDDFVKKILKATQRNNIHPSSLKLELTESVAIDNLEDTIEKMNLLKFFGFKIAMDDFGTGYSSLSYLKNLPFDYIKIDRSFVKDMLENKDDASLIKTILAISKQFKFDVIAEGVETIEHIKVLKSLDCDYIQGYVISKAVPADKFRELFQH